MAGELRVPADYPTVREALLAATTADTVTVAAGLYRESNLALHSGLLLRGVEGEPAAVVLDAGGTHLLSGSAGLHDLMLVDLTLRNGFAADGGALRLDSVRDLTITRCVFEGNEATGAGGAVVITQPAGWDNGLVIFEDCMFGYNSALGDGGGVALTGDATFRRCTFTANISDICGGGISQNGGSLLVEDCGFIGNAAGVAGGGLRAQGAPSRVRNCKFKENHAFNANGGGADLDEADISGCAFLSNQTGMHGGGLQVSSLQLLDDCEFVGNSAAFVGGGAKLGGGEITGCLFSDNTSGVSGAGVLQTGATALFSRCTWASNQAFRNGGAFASVVTAAVYTFDNCQFDANGAPSAAEGQIEDSSSAILKCCNADPRLWASGDVMLDHSSCPIARESLSFGELKLRFR